MALSVFDRIVSDSGFNDEIEQDTVDLMLKIMKPSKAMKIDEYLQKVLKSYVRRKKKIAVNLSGIDVIQKAVSGFVIEADIEEIDIDDDWNPNSLSSRSNLLSAELFTALPNVTEIIIKTSMGDSPYPFNVLYLLKSMNTTLRLQKIKIEQLMMDEENENKSWLYKLWNSEVKQLIMEECAKYQFKIYFDKTIVHTENYLCFESIIIERHV